MSELVFNDETKRVRASLRMPESPLVQELRLPNFQSMQGRLNLDGSIELPTLNDWREAEREARQRIAARDSAQSSNTRPS